MTLEVVTVTKDNSLHCNDVHGDFFLSHEKGKDILKVGPATVVNQDESPPE